MTVTPAITSDQEALREAFGTFFAKESPPEVVRGAEPLGFDPAPRADSGPLTRVGSGLMPGQDTGSPSRLGTGPMPRPGMPTPSGDPATAPRTGPGARTVAQPSPRARSNDPRYRDMRGPTEGGGR